MIVTNRQVPHMHRKIVPYSWGTDRKTPTTVVGPILVGTSGNHTFEHALFGGWRGPHFSGNLMQSYIRTYSIRCVVGAPILVETSCNHTFKHALLGVWWGPHFSGNLMQSYIKTCTIWCVWGPHFSGNFMQFHTFFIIYTLVSGLTILSLQVVWLSHQNMGPHQKKSRTKYYMFNVCSYIVGMPNRMNKIQHGIFVLVSSPLFWWKLHTIIHIQYMYRHTVKC